jgi:hypothetical protein
MEIKVGIGIDDIKFGNSIQEIESILGRPDAIKKDEEYGEFEPMYIYNSRKLSLTFYKNHNERLGYIRSSNSKLTINGSAFIGLPIHEALEIFKQQIGNDWELEEYDFWNQYFNEKNWIVLRVEYDLVTEIELGVPFINEEEYNWPK